MPKSLALDLKEISPLSARAMEIEIVDEQTMGEAAEFLSQLNKRLNKVIAYKETKTKPLLATLKIIRGETKPFETAFEEAIEMVRGKMSTYQTEQKRLADEEAAKIAARVGEGKGHLKVETAVRKIEEIDTPEKKVIAESGSVSFIEVRKFEVMDVTLLPTSYVLPDLVAIRKAMLAGVELPGCRYYVVQEPRNVR